MTFYFDATPFLAKFSIRIDEKGASLNSANLFAIHVFHFDDIESITEGFLGIGN